MRRVLGESLIHGMQDVMLPHGSVILTAMITGMDELYLFYECDDEDRYDDKRVILVAKRDEELPSYERYDLKHITSLQSILEVGGLVHVFEVIAK